MESIKIKEVENISCWDNNVKKYSDNYVIFNAGLGNILTNKDNRFFIYNQFGLQPYCEAKVFHPLHLEAKKQKPI